MPKEFGNGPPTAEFLYTVLHDQLMCMVGTFVGVFLSGILVILGICVFLLSSKKATISRQDYFLRTYTAILISLVVAFEIQAFILGNAPVLTLFETPAQVKQLGTALIIVFNISLVVTVGLTDGLMVWRCFMVQRALGPNLSIWGNIFWVIPACLWVVLAGTGIAASILNRGPVYDILGTTGYAANTVLNLYATCFITTRLLMHRRLVKARLGNNEAVTVHHLRIIGILLESAAINVPVTIVAAVGMGTGRAFIETVLTPTISASQVCHLVGKNIFGTTVVVTERAHVPWDHTMPNSGRNSHCNSTSHHEKIGPSRVLPTVIPSKPDSLISRACREGIPRGTVPVGFSGAALCYGDCNYSVVLESSQSQQTNDSEGSALGTFGRNGTKNESDVTTLRIGQVATLLCQSAGR